MRKEPEHGPDRVNGDEHPLRLILTFPESEAGAGLKVTREGHLDATGDCIPNDRIEPHRARNTQRRTKRINGKVRTGSLALPASVHGYQ